MLPKESAYVKSYGGETNWMYILLKMMNYYKHITVFGIKSVIVIRKNLISNPSKIKKILKTKQGLTMMRLQIFMMEKYLKKSPIILV